MKKKKLEKKIKELRKEINLITKTIIDVSETINKNTFYCENYKPRTVTFKRYTPLPKIDTEEGKQT